MTRKIEIAQAGYLPTYDECYVCGQFHPRGKFFLLSADQTLAIVERMTYQPGDPLVFREAQS